MRKLEWDDQVKIIEKCVKNGKQLHEVLKERDLSYEDLAYYHECEFKTGGGRYNAIDAFSTPCNGIQVASFFSGCGGLDLGFEAAGFDHAVCIDNNELFCDTLRLNRPEWKIIGPPESKGDVSDRDELYRELKQYIDVDFEGFFIGGPPCQPFSIAANQRFAKRDKNYKRIGFSHETHGNLFFDFIWFIKKFKPSAFLIENVVGLKTIDKAEQLNNAINLLSKEGYFISNPTVLDAADFGVPQHRKRLFIIGSRKNTCLFPNVELERIPCHKVLKPSKNGIENHTTRKHNAESIKRYMMLKCRERDILGRVNRLDPNLPSRTVIAGGCSGGGRSHLHPAIPRTLSVRESARLQTFPDSFIFHGSIARQFTQVGNAVPPVLAFHLAKSLAQQAFGI